MSASQQPPSSAIMNAGPRPSNEYLAQSNINAKRIPEKLPLLVILDLNGCLVARKGSDIELRDDVKPFLQYLLHEHWVMIWSSATATSVQRMIDKLFTTVEEQARLVAIWDRSHFDLTVEQYHSNPQVYKRLTRVWGSDYIQQTHPLAAVEKRHRWAYWNFYNTVLIDDSFEKAAYEPYNHVRVPEMLHSKEPMKFAVPVLPQDTTVLSQVAGYLDQLKHSCNVANSIKNEPFKLDDGYNLNWREFWELRSVVDFVEEEDEDMEDRPPNYD